MLLLGEREKDGKRNVRRKDDTKSASERTDENDAIAVIPA